VNFLPHHGKLSALFAFKVDESIGGLDLPLNKAISNHRMMLNLEIIGIENR